MFLVKMFLSETLSPSRGKEEEEEEEGESVVDADDMSLVHLLDAPADKTRICRSRSSTLLSNNAILLADMTSPSTSIAKDSLLVFTRSQQKIKKSAR